MEGAENSAVPILGYCNYPNKSLENREVFIPGSIKGADSTAFLSGYFSSAGFSIPQTQQNTNEWRVPVGHDSQEVARVFKDLVDYILN